MNMAQGFPSMTALLGLLAIAGYQNRDKLAEMLGGTGQGQSGTPGQGNRQGSTGQGGAGSASGGLGGLLGGHGDKAESWVGSGQNKEIAPRELEQAIDADTLATLAQQTGLSREELLARLSRELPSAVDRYTP